MIAKDKMTIEQLEAYNEMLTKEIKENNVKLAKKVKRVCEEIKEALLWLNNS